MEEEKKDITVIDEGIKDEFFMHCCIGPFMPTWWF